MKDYEAAIRTFRRAVKLDPSHVKGYNNLGAALAESGDVDGAIRSFKEAIARDPGYANSYKNLAMAYAAQNRLVDAKTNLEEYMKRAPGDSAAAAALRKIASTIEANRALTPYRSQ